MSYNYNKYCNLGQFQTITGIICPQNEAVELQIDKALYIANMFKM